MQSALNIVSEQVQALGSKALDVENDSDLTKEKEVTDENIIQYGRIEEELSPIDKFMGRELQILNHETEAVDKEWFTNSLSANSLEDESRLPYETQQNF